MSPLSRRNLLTASSLSMAAATLGVRHASAGPPTSSTTIAYVTDVHIDIEDQTKTARARATANALVELDPDLVIHGGDLTEYGSESEFRTWLDLFPASLRKRMQHVPGNHESRWDGAALETFDRVVGPRNHSIDLDDLHIAFVDLTTPQQEYGFLDDAGRAWLRKDLTKAAGRPSIVVSHYPVGLTPYQVRNGDQVMDLLAEAGVSGYLCGHIHREEISHTNGLTEIVGLANQDEPGYYLLTRRADEISDVLEVERVTIADPTDPEVIPVRREVTTINLGPDRTQLRPELSRATVLDTGLAVDTTLAAGTDVDRVVAMVMDHTKVGGGVIADSDWTPLVAEGDRWSGTVDLSEVPPGEHRVLVRVIGTDGRWWQNTHHIRVAGFAPAWTVGLRGGIQAALARVDDLVVAASTTGDVRAVHPSARRARPVWRARIGPVHNDPALSEGRIHLPSADHHLHTLSTATGKTLWRADLGDPVMSDLTVATVDATEMVFAAAMTTLFCLDAADGSVVWQWEMDQICGGPVSCDGELVHLGGGDGNLWALNARTGEPLWHLDHSNGNDDTYRRLIWGPWESRTLPVADGLMLACSRQRLRGSDPRTGETIWEIEGHYRHSNPQWYGDDVLLAREEGQVQLLDPTTGEVRIELASVPLLGNAGLVTDDAQVVVTGVGGLVATVDLEAGTTRTLGQISPAYVYSTPLVIDGLYVVATLQGELRGYDLAG